MTNARKKYNEALDEYKRKGELFEQIIKERCYWVEETTDERNKPRQFLRCKDPNEELQTIRLLRAIELDCKFQKEIVDEARIKAEIIESPLIVIRFIRKCFKRFCGFCKAIERDTRPE